MSAPTVEVDLAYGRDGLRVTLPRDRTTIITPVHQDAAADAAGT